MNWDLFGSAEQESREDALPASPRRRVPVSGGSVAASGPAVYTVSAANALAKRVLEGQLPPLWVGGEVAGWKHYPASGHCYFTLRDKRAQLRCVMYDDDARRLPTHPDDGMQVRAFGKLTLYEKKGEYQLVVRALEGAGAGGLWRLAFERTRAKLEAEGLLAPERKRPLPRFPGTVGVVTSPVGAALHDILHVIERRAPWTRVIFCPARVQGEGAAQDLARAVQLFSRARVADVLIVGRGGGAMEDLWAFNEEVLARAIAACPVPVVSAVGHEVDVTIADLVADVRAPTPSAAAERAVPEAATLRRQLGDLSFRMTAAAQQRATRVRRELEWLAAALRTGMREAVAARQDRLAHAAAKLEVLSPLAALARGYAVPLDAQGRILRRVASFTPGDPVRLRIVDGNVGCRVESVAPDPDGEKQDV